MLAGATKTKAEADMRKSSKSKKATKRARRKKSDAYLTPPWCVHRLLEADGLDLPGGSWLEPAAGPGRIISAVNSMRDDVRWDAIELRDKCGPDLVKAVGSSKRVVIGDFLSTSPPEKHYDVIFTNPPFSLAMKFVEKCLATADHVAMLLRLGFLGSADRADFFREHPPDIYLLPDRPSFTDDGKNDNSYYAWFIWRPGGRTEGVFRVLRTTPLKYRSLKLYTNGMSSIPLLVPDAPHTMMPEADHPGDFMPNTDPTITAQIETFTQQLVATVEAAVAQRIQAALAGAFGIPQKRGPGRPPKQAVAHVAAPKPARKKQICPVPGCKNVAAPIFGMVCKDHKNVAKSKIKKYREQRRDGKSTQATGARPAVAKKAKKATPKIKRARKLQGQYLGALKSLTGADRAKVKQTAAEKGVAEAVKLAVSMKKA